MATAGAANNTNDVATHWGSSFASVITSFPESGTLDSVHLYIAGYGTGGNYDARVAVYQDSTADTAMTGATLVWDSGEVDAGAWTPLGSGNGAWVTINAGGESLTSGQNLWIAIKGKYGYYLSDVDNATDAGDLALRIQVHGEGDDETVAFSATAGTDSSTYSVVRAIKAYVTYTASGGGSSILPLLNAYYG